MKSACAAEERRATLEREQVQAKVPAVMCRFEEDEEGGCASSPDELCPPEMRARAEVRQAEAGLATEADGEASKAGDAPEAEASVRPPALGLLGGELEVREAELALRTAKAEAQREGAVRQLAESRSLLEAGARQLAEREAEQTRQALAREREVTTDPPPAVLEGR